MEEKKEEKKTENEEKKRENKKALEKEQSIGREEEYDQEITKTLARTRTFLV